MNQRIENLLKNLAMQPRTAKFFTHHTAFQGLTEAMLMTRLEALVADDLAVKEKNLWAITDAGRQALAELATRKKAEAKQAFSHENWKQPAWHVRTGGEDHKRIPSRGF